MTKQKPKTQDEWYDPPQFLGVGSYSIWRENVRRKTPDIKIVGFVRGVNNDKQAKTTKTKIRRPR